MINLMLILTYVISVFTMCMNVVAITAVMLALTEGQCAILHNLIKGMVLKAIHDQNLAPPAGKWLSPYFVIE